MEPCFEPEQHCRAIDQKPIQPTTRELGVSVWMTQRSLWMTWKTEPDFCSLSFSGQRMSVTEPKRKVEKHLTHEVSVTDIADLFFLGGSLVLCLWRALIWPHISFQRIFKFSFRSLIGVLLYHHRVFLFTWFCLLYYISRCIFWQIPC